VKLDGRPAGRATVLSLACRQRIDERLRGWSVALAEVGLAGLGEGLHRYGKLAPVPEHPRVRLDFSFVADARRRYAQIAQDLSAFEHALLVDLCYVGSFEGGSVPAGKRSFTLRAEIGRSDRTLTDADVQSFRAAFTSFLGKLGLELRA
jgi:phenylalanyl-tRNA synthetase beta subunit